MKELKRMFPSDNEFTPMAEGNSSLELPLVPDHNTPPPIYLYSGRKVGGQGHCESKLPPIETLLTASGEAPLKRTVAQVEGKLPGETLKRKCMAHENEYQQSPSITRSQQLMAVCQQRKIVVKPTLDKLINLCPDEQKTQLIDMLVIYFENVETFITNTSTITSMLLRGGGTSGTKRYIGTFLGIQDPDVKLIAQSPYLRSISSICNGKGFPKTGDVIRFLELPCALCMVMLETRCHEADVFAGGSSGGIVVTTGVFVASICASCARFAVTVFLTSSGITPSLSFLITGLSTLHKSAVSWPLLA